MSKSRRGQYKKIAGGGNGADRIPARKAGVFKVLLLKIVEAKGGYDHAREFIPLGGTAIENVLDGDVTALSARRILDAYNRL